MYLVKLDLSVKGLPAFCTRGYKRHVSMCFHADTPLIALYKAEQYDLAPKFEDAISELHGSILFALLLDSEHIFSSGDVVMTARYTVIDCDYDERVATYTRYFNFDL